MKFVTVNAFNVSRNSGGLNSQTVDVEELNLVQGQRGKNLLYHEGFLYARNNQTTEATYWCCRTRTSGQSCRARITTTKRENGLTRINVTQPLHNHLPTTRMLKKLEKVTK